ncbi:hypothetical protein [Butyrivibrio sp. WCD2001]|uniref:hypothetical protein n=1 Tax=Butyrivibrio sp. WCD2001 TaxID=1280681 RepID=UPI000424A82E|nr:hypothetical protein [Butyrivibrio sp. WCD2001]
MDAIVVLLRKLKLPFAYDHFAEGKGPDPPFVIYRCAGTDNFPADDRVYFPVEDIVIELYTDKKEPATEKKLEKLLTDAGIFYEKSEIYITTEKLYEVTYSFEQGKD